MRSKKTTNILLLLAFLFILTIIILCLLPTHKGPADDPHYKEFEQHESGKTSKITPKTTTTAKTTTIKPTNGTTVTTTEPLNTPSTIEEDEEEITSSTAKSTTIKYLSPTTVKEKTPSSSTPSSEKTSLTSTTLKPTTLPKDIDNTTTEHSTDKQTETYNNQSYTLFEASTETSYKPSENETKNNTSSLSTIPTTTLPTSTTTPTTTTTTTTTTIPTTTTTTTIPTTTTTSTTTTTPIPTTVPYDHTFTLYTKHEGVCTSNGCKDISGKMLDSLDHEADPCENFHEYSCGGVHKDQFLRPESAEENLDKILKEQLVSHETYASKFYDSCLNYFDGAKNFKHENIFPTDWKVDFPKSEHVNWPSDHLTNTIKYLIKRDLSVLFDVTVDVKKLDGTIKILPKLRISLLDDYEDHYDHKYCIDQFHRRMLELNKKVEKYVPPLMMDHYEKGEQPDDGKGKPENQTEAKVDNSKMNSIKDEEVIAVDINAEYDRYHECMNTTGLDLRMNRLKSVLMESDLFAAGLKPLEKQSQVEKVRDFLIDLNGILFVPTNAHGAGTPSEVITLRDLMGNTVIGGLIKWDSLFESLLGFKFDESEEIVVENLSKFSRIFSYFKDLWNDKNLENVLLMLAGEKLFKKAEDREYKKDFCFKITKKYFPLDMQLLFTKSFSEEDLNVLVSEIYNLGEALPVKVPRLFSGYKPIQTPVEFIDLRTLKSNIEDLKSELVLSGDFLDDLNHLQTRYRKDMHNMTGEELMDTESCRLLPREVQIVCNLHADRILVPLEQLVAPNFLFRKDVPNYLRLAGVTNYMANMMALNFGTDEINIKDYKGNECLIENIPTFFEERNAKRKIRYEADVSEEMKGETLLQFQAFNIAWQVLKHLHSGKSGLKLNETEELPLIWLGSKPLNPLKAFLIRKAQESCNENNEFDLIRISRFKSPPKFFWINSLIKIDTLFGGAWHCAENTSMAETRECPTEKTTIDWFNPYASPSPPHSRLLR